MFAGASFLGLATEVMAGAVDSTLSTVSAIMVRSKAEQVIAIILRKAAQDHAYVIGVRGCASRLTGACGRFQLVFAEQGSGHTQLYLWIVFIFF